MYKGKKLEKQYEKNKRLTVHESFSLGVCEDDHSYRLITTDQPKI